MQKVNDPTKNESLKKHGSAAKPGHEPQHIGEGFPSMGSETRAHMGGNMDGYSHNM